MGLFNEKEGCMNGVRVEVHIFSNDKEYALGFKEDSYGDIKTFRRILAVLISALKFSAIQHFYGDTTKDERCRDCERFVLKNGIQEMFYNRDGDGYAVCDDCVINNAGKLRPSNIPVKK